MNLLITGAVSWQKDFFETLRNMGHDIRFIQDERIPLGEYDVEYGWVEGIIGNGLFLYNDIRKFVNLKWIQLTSAGYDRVPMGYIRENSISIYNARGVYSIPMAEFAISGVLQLYKKSVFFQENKKKHIWGKNREIVELNGKTVCIVGCGSVGRECAKRFAAFGCRVLGVDKAVSNNGLFEKVEPLEKLNDFLKVSDIVILTLPLSEETRHLINEKRLSLIKRTGILVNIARGAILDQRALEVKLLENKMFGAVLDVFEEEPLKEESILWNMENVILTPHNSFVSENNIFRLQSAVLNNIQQEKFINV